MEIPEDEEIFQTADGFEISGLFYGSSFDASPGNHDVVSTKSCLHTESPLASDLKEGARLLRVKNGEVHEVGSSRNTGLGFFEVELKAAEETDSSLLGRF